MKLIKNLLDYNRFSSYQLAIIFWIAISLFACKPNEQQDNEKAAVDTAANTGQEALTVDQMEARNGERIDRVVTTTQARILNRQLDQIMDEADTILSNYVGVWELEKHFSLTESLYGKLVDLKDFGSDMMVGSKMVNMIAIFDKGDSLKLSLGLRLYKDDVKVAYLGFAPFRHVPVPEKVLGIVDPVVSLIATKNTKEVYSMCTKKFQQTTSLEEMESYFKKNITSQAVAYKVNDTTPIIFDRNEVGYYSGIYLSYDGKEEPEQAFGLKLILDPQTDELKIDNIQFAGDQS